MSPYQQKAWEAWVETRPAAVQHTARKYPVGTKFNLHGKTAWVVSYEEDGGLSVSFVDPSQDYDAAVKSRQPICVCCATDLSSLVIK